VPLLLDGDHPAVGGGAREQILAERRFDRRQTAMKENDGNGIRPGAMILMINAKPSANLVGMVLLDARLHYLLRVRERF
jgi:hypothetical protein